MGDILVRHRQYLVQHPISVADTRGGGNVDLNEVVTHRPHKLDLAGKARIIACNQQKKTTKLFSRLVFYDQFFTEVFISSLR